MEPVLIPDGDYIMQAKSIEGRLIRWEILAGEFKGQIVFGPAVVMKTVGHRVLESGEVIANAIKE